MKKSSSPPAAKAVFRRFSIQKPDGLKDKVEEAREFVINQTAAIQHIQEF